MATSLYRHFNADGELLYVGIASQPLQRLRQHKRESDWFAEIATITIQHFSRRRRAEQAERVAIRREKPKYNSVRYRRKKPSPTRSKHLVTRAKAARNPKPIGLIGPQMPAHFQLHGPPKPYFHRVRSLGPEGEKHASVDDDLAFHSFEDMIAVTRDGDFLEVHPDYQLTADEWDCLLQEQIFVMPRRGEKWGPYARHQYIFALGGRGAEPRKLPPEETDE